MMEIISSYGPYHYARPMYCVELYLHSHGEETNTTQNSASPGIQGDNLLTADKAHLQAFRGGDSRANPRHETGGDQNDRRPFREQARNLADPDGRRRTRPLSVYDNIVRYFLFFRRTLRLTPRMSAANCFCPGSWSGP